MFTSRSCGWGPLFGAGLILYAAACGGADETTIALVEAPVHLPRIQDRALPVPDAGLLLDFDAVGNELYVLERGNRVRVLVRTDTAWQLLRAFGREGSGPGELSTAWGMSADADGVVISEADRLQFFSGSGDFRSTHRLELPCRMLQPAVVAAGPGLFVYGDCRQRGLTTDTVYATLAWTPDTARYEIVTRELRYTSDGRLGSIFGAPRPLVSSASGTVHGTGLESCLTHVTAGGGTAVAMVPASNRQCALVTTLFRSEPPPDVRRRMEAGPIAGMRVTWPETLPVFMAALPVPAGLLLLRPYSADSLLLQLAEPDGRQIAVAPLDGLIGCKAVGCLWLFEDDAMPRMLLLDTTAIRNLIDDPVLQ